MRQPTLAMLTGAEVRKLASRLSVRLSLAALALLGLGVPLAFFAFTLMASDVPTQPGAEVMSPFSATSVLVTVLGIRNFFLFRAMLIAVVAVSVAGEFVSRTLREDLLRPVSRTQVVTAKLLALQGFVVMGALVPLLTSLPLAVALFGATGDVQTQVVRFALAALGDLGFCTLVVALAFGLRSVPGTIGGVFVYWLADRALGVVLWIAEQMRDGIDSMLRRVSLEDMMTLVDGAIAARPWLPSAAFNLDWDYSAGAGLPWVSALALVVYTALSYAAAVAILTRVDVD